jgi:hypothetical protein
LPSSREVRQRRMIFMDEFLAFGRSGPSSAIGLKVFFALLEVVIIGAGIVIFRSRKTLFAYRKNEGDTYASANLRMAMVILVWIHAVVITALMIYEV